MLVILFDACQFLRVQLPKPYQQHGCQCSMSSDHWDGVEGSRFGQDSSENGMGVVEEKAE